MKRSATLTALCFVYAAQNAEAFGFFGGARTQPVSTPLEVNGEADAVNNVVDSANILLNLTRLETGSLMLETLALGEEDVLGDNLAAGAAVPALKSASGVLGAVPDSLYGGGEEDEEEPDLAQAVGSLEAAVDELSITDPVAAVVSEISVPPQRRFGFLEEALAKLSYHRNTLSTLPLNGTNATQSASGEAEDVEEEGFGQAHVASHLLKPIARYYHPAGVNAGAVGIAKQPMHAEVLGDENDAGDLLLEEEEMGSPTATGFNGTLGTLDGSEVVTGATAGTEEKNLVGEGDINGQIPDDDGVGDTAGNIATTVAASAGLLGAVGGGVMLWRRRRQNAATEGYNSPFRRRNSNESLSRRYLHV